MPRIDPPDPDAAVLWEFGRRMKEARTSAQLTQRELAAEAGVGLATLKRLEGGAPVGTDRLVRVLRALGLLDTLDSFIPAGGRSPLEIASAHGDLRRRRVRHPQAGRPAGSAWSWDDS